MTTVQLQIPDDLAKAAKREGLLSPEAMVAILQDALRRCAGKRLIEITEPATHSQSDMSEEEIQAFVQSEIDEYRSGK